MEHGVAIKRRRVCESCNSRFSTVERYYPKELFVIKRSGIRKPFDINKIISSIKTAVRKRNISQDQIQKIAQNILKFVENAPGREVSTVQIGEQIMSALSEIDKVAYIRFASVYHDFDSAEDFLKFII
jgi:transcriptional repressor NrdR